MNIVTPVFVDWITATGGQSTSGTWLQKHLTKEVSAPTHRGYHRSHAVQYYPSGWRYYYTPDALDEPCVMVMDGGALSNIRREEGNDYASKVVAQVARATSKFTRIDLTIDFVDHGTFARSFHEFMSKNKDKWANIFPRRKVTLIDSGGTTVYIGSRQSPLMLRIYDKATESKGIVGTSRLEIELKGHYAKQCHSIIRSEFGWSKATTLYTSFIRSVSTWEDFPEVESLLVGEVIQIDKEEREPRSDVKDWLKRQVLPSFVRSPEQESGDLWEWFKGMVEAGRLGA